MRWTPAISIVLLLAIHDSATAQSASRLIDGVEASERLGHTDISVLFGCGLRYVSHTPASEGDSLRVRLVPLPNCGPLVTGALAAPPSLGDVKDVRSIDVETLAGNDLYVTFQFASKERYVLAPTADSHGLRIRLLRPETDRSHIVVFDKNGPPATYAVNLAAAEQPFAADEIARAKQETGTAAYISEYRLGDRTWYRLRVGPFESEDEARKVLTVARSNWPKAWLAIGDDDALNAPSDVTGTQSVPPTLPGHSSTLTGPDIEVMLLKAKKAVTRKDYGTAVPLLTRLLEQPEFPQRAQAQELMGLARERSGQLAHAKAEYEEYLRRYPEGPAVKRVRERLRVLALAARRSINGGRSGGEEQAWRIYGGASQIYRRDDTHLDNDAFSTSVTSQDALINDFDIVARRRGERFDFSARAGAGYIKDLMTDGPGDQTRLDAAFVELGDRELDWSARLGRQSRSSGGLFGTFDGLYAGYQLRPRLRINTALGFPVETSRDSLDTGRTFYGLALDVGTFANAWDFTLYGVSQQLSGDTDRQALGTELRYFRPGRTAVVLVDYDLHFQELNNAVLLANFELPRRWTVSANLDWRKSPSLSLRNALIGQPVTSFNDLLNLFPRSQLEQLALDRSADSRLYSVSLGRPVGERWQWSLDYSAISTGVTPASGGVDEVPATGTDNAITLQGTAAGLFGGSDFSTIVLRRQTGESLNIDSIGLATRVPWGRVLRIGPRLRVDRRDIVTDGSEEMLYAPSVRLDMQRGRSLFECELGAELARRALGSSLSTTTRYYFSLGYRLNF